MIKLPQKFQPLYRHLHFVHAIFKVNQFNVRKKNSTVDECVDFAFKYFNRPIPLWQIRQEMIELMNLLKVRNVNRILEIGTAGGGSLFLFTRVASKDARLISIDYRHGQFGGGYPKSRKILYKFTARSKQRIHLIAADSHNPHTVIKLKKFIHDEWIDFLFIDGDHSYAGVKKDFELYYPLVRSKGMIAFHDIVPGLPTQVGGVPQYWEEIKSHYDHMEIVNDWNQGGYGMGVIFKN